MANTRLNGVPLVGEKLSTNGATVLKVSAMKPAEPGSVEYGVVLCLTPDIETDEFGPGRRFVVWMYRTADGLASSGRYTDDLADAMAIYSATCRLYNVAEAANHE